MRIGILDIDTKKEKNNREAVEKYPNPACGKIYGYHKMNGDEIFYPWDAKTKVDKLYISTIFSWTKKPLLKMLPIYEKYAKEILIGGSGWDNYTSFKEYIITDLPPEIKKVHHRWTYELYDIDYGIGKTSEGCHVGCGFCMVPKKEGLQERRVNTIEDIINPKYYDRNSDGSLKYPGSDHIVLMNNNSLADPGFYDDVNMINELKLSVHWDQANHEWRGTELKLSLIKEDRIYTNENHRSRMVREIKSKDGKTYVVYLNVGRILVRGMIHLMGTQTCRIETFARWAVQGCAKDEFVLKREVEDGGSTE